MDFYKTHWQRKIALSDQVFHTWQFEDAVENRGANTCVVALKDGILVGVMGLNKRIFVYGDKRLNGAELTTWVVDTEFKGAGAGAKILNFIINNFEVLFGMGISQDALPIYLRSGFHYLRYIPRYIHVIDILGPKSSYESAIKFIESYAQDNDYWAVDVYSTLAHLNKYFSSRKWLSAVDSMFINVPHLFHPLEVRNPATTSLIYWSKNSNVDFLDLSCLYLTKQDCDLDRPTMNFIGC